MCTQSLKEIDVYLIAGQSNAAGYSFHDGKFTETFQNIWYAAETDRYRDGSYLGSSHIESFSEFCFEMKAGLGTIPDRIGPEYGMAKVLAPYYSKENPALIFKSAAGGTALRDVAEGENVLYGNWYPRSLWPSGFVPSNDSTTGLQYYRFVENFKKVYRILEENGYVARVRGMVWMQGCSDLSHEEEYRTLLPVLIADFRRDLIEITKDETLAEMPFVIGKIATTEASYNNPAVPPFNAVQQHVADTTVGVSTVETADLIIVGPDGKNRGRDPYHFTGEDALTLGMRFGEKIKPTNCSTSKS